MYLWTHLEKLNVVLQAKFLNSKNPILVHLNHESERAAFKPYMKTTEKKGMATFGQKLDKCLVDSSFKVSIETGDTS